MSYKNINKKCKFKDCHVYPSFNYRGKKDAIYCCRHCLPEMINVRKKLCKFDGCETHPSYNYPKFSIGVYCQKHSLQGMINIVSRKCKFEDCTIIACYNYPTEEKPAFCATHAEPNMILVGHIVCKEPGCHIKASSNYPGEIGYIYCSKHRLPGMINKRSCKYKHKEAVNNLRLSLHNINNNKPGVTYNTSEPEPVIIPIMPETIANTQYQSETIVLDTVKPIKGLLKFENGQIVVA